MGLKKKAVLVFSVLIAVSFVFAIFNAVAYDHAEELDISVDSYAQPSGILSSLSVSEEDLGIFPEYWELTFLLSVRNGDSSNHQMEEATYAIYLGDERVSEGQYRNMLLRSHLTTRLPNATLTLSMADLAENNPQFLANVLERDGKMDFKISVTVKTPALLFGVLRIGAAETSEDLYETIQVVDSISVRSFRWRSGRFHVKECHPGEDLIGEFSVSKEGSTEGVLVARATELSSDGRERDLFSQELQGLTYGYQGLNLSWHVPEVLPMTCIGFSVHLSYGGIEIWSAPLDPLPLELVRKYTLSEALREDNIDVAVKGRGYCAGDALKLEVKVELEVSIDLELEAGTIMVNSGAGQNMIVGERRTFRVKPKLDVELDLEVEVEAYCLDLHRDNPNSSETFAALEGLGEYSGDAVKLMESLEDVSYEHKSVSGVQIALWVIVGNPSREEVDQVLFVSESSLEDAAWLLQNIGIDPNEKELFRDV